MNVVVNSQLLADELRLLNKVVPSKPAIAALAYALFEASGDALRFWATDLEIGVATRCPAQVAAPGASALPVARFLGMLEQFPNADVSLQAQQSSVVVRCGSFASRIQTMSASEHPAMPTPSGQSCTVDAALLRLLISRTRQSIATTTGKYVLQGALLTLAGESMVMASTDGKRLSLATAARTAGADFEVVIPTKTLDVVASSRGEGDAELTVGQNHIFLTTGDATIVSRRLEGQFPNYRRIIPNNDKKFDVDRATLASALRRVVQATEENKAVWWHLKPGTLEMTAQAVGLGSAAEPVPVAYDGEELKVCINGEFALDFLNVATEPTINVSLKDNKSPLKMMDNVDHMSVIMLMKA